MSTAPPVFLISASLPSSIVALVVIVYSALRAARNPHDKRWGLLLAASALTIPGSAFAGVVLAAISKLVPYKMDEYVFRYDVLFGEPSFVLARFFAPHLWLQCALAAIYNLLPCVWLFVFAAYLWKVSEKQAFEVVRVYVLFLVLAVPLYLIFPVCGPYYAFPGFPFDMPEIIPHPLRLNAPPNGVPSIHMASALVTVYFLRRWRCCFVLSCIFLVFTIIATLESGEHYLFDLIVAFPFTALVLLLAKDGRKEERVPILSDGQLEVNFASMASMRGPGSAVLRSDVAEDGGSLSPLR